MSKFYRTLVALLAMAVRASDREGRLEFKFAADNIPAPDKMEKGGEDASFAGKNILCVADGVGGWSEYGIDPSLFSKNLAANVGKFFEEDPKTYTSNPKSLLIKAVENTKFPGTSTLALVILDPDTGLLRASYIGDSSYMIIRRNATADDLFIFHRSREQVHKFNFPFQVGAYGDNALKAKAFEHQLEVGDIVVIGTDGLFDNVFNSRILKEVKAKKDKSAKTIAETLANIAFKLSLKTKYKSPFSKGALKAGFFYVGGKSDDITVAVGKVVRRKHAVKAQKSDIA